MNLLPPRTDGPQGLPMMLHTAGNEIAAMILEDPATFYGYDPREIRQPRREARMTDAKMTQAWLEHADLAALRGDGGANVLIGQELREMYTDPRDGQKRHVVKGVPMAKIAQRAGVSIRAARRHSARFRHFVGMTVRQKSIDYLKPDGTRTRRGVPAVREFPAKVIDRVPGLRPAFERERAKARQRRDLVWNRRKVHWSQSDAARERAATSAAAKFTRQTEKLARSSAEQLERIRGYGDRPPDRGKPRR